MRVVIADDTALLRQGIARLLTDAGVDVIGEADDATQLLDLIDARPPDVAIVDIRMPPGHTDEGLVAAATIRERFPEVGVLVLSQYVEPAYALRLIEGTDGGCGYLLKDSVMNARELVSAVERVAAGEVVVDPELVDQLLSRPRTPGAFDELTKREREVLGLMAEGLTDRGIAERLWLTPRTVETHVRHILAKLDLPVGSSNNRRVHAVLAYLRARSRASSHQRARAPCERSRVKTSLDCLRRHPLGWIDVARRSRERRRLCPLPRASARSRAPCAPGRDRAQLSSRRGRADRPPATSVAAASS